MRSVVCLCDSLVNWREPGILDYCRNIGLENRNDFLSFLPFPLTLGCLLKSTLAGNLPSEFCMFTIVGHPWFHLSG